MSEKYLKINDFNPLDYVSDSFMILYMGYQKTYKNNPGLRKKYKDSKNLDKRKGLIQIAEEYGIKDFISTDEYIEFTYMSLIKIYFLYELHQLKLDTKIIKTIFLNLEENKKLNSMTYIFDLYAGFAKKGEEVNFYIIDGITTVLLEEQYNANKCLFGPPNSIIIVSLNLVLSKIIKNIPQATNRLHILNDKEFKIHSEMNFNSDMTDFNITFEKDGYTPKELNIKTKSELTLNGLNDLQKLKKEAKDIDFGNLGEIKVHGKKLKLSGNKSKKISLDKKKRKG